MFVKELYPAMLTVALTNGNEMPVSVSIFGPGVKTGLALAREIIKGTAYKNWRLNGEFIFNPAGDPDRFNVFLPGDLAAMELVREAQPATKNTKRTTGWRKNSAGTSRNTSEHTPAGG